MPREENLARLRDIYYEPETGFGSAQDTYRQAKAMGLTTGSGKLTMKDVKQFLRNQESEQITKKFRRPTKFTSIRAKAVGTDYQADLMEFGHKRDGYRFLLNVIDIHSRYAWSVPIRNKKGETVVQAFKQHVDIKRSPKGKVKLEHIHTDEGTEFLNRHFQKMLNDFGVRHTYSREGEYAKNSIVERFNRTLRDKMQKQRGTFKIGDERFRQIVKNYNNKIHRTIKAAPVEVWNKRKKNTQHYRDMLYGFKKGDRVRLLFKKKLFEKGTYGWTDEVYKISSIVKQRHYVKDSKGNQKRDKQGKKQYYMGYQLMRVDAVERDPSVSAAEQKKASRKEEKARGKKKLERKLKKEGLDATPALRKKSKRIKAPAQVAAKKKTIKLNKKQTFLAGKVVGKKIEIKYKMDDGTTRWYEGEITSHSKGTYSVKFADGTYRYNFKDKRSPNYIEPRSWRVV